MTSKLLAALSPLALFLASCGLSAAGENPSKVHEVEGAFAIEVLGTFDEPWALTTVPGTGLILVTEKGGKLKVWERGQPLRDVAGVPVVAYGGQGGLGDVALSPTFPNDNRIFLTWAEAGSDDRRGAALGTGLLDLSATAPRIVEFEVIWRQQPKTTGQGHYSHRIAFSPDGRYLFIASGERQKMAPAQDMGGNLGKIVRLLPDGTPAPGNPFAAQGGIAAQVWTLGHRNILGLKFDASGRLWGLEHGPAGGDELNLIKPGVNFGWPLVSQGRHYSGEAIPPHSSRPDLAAPAIWWNPVIGPGDFIFHSGRMWPEWKGQALIAGLVSEGLVRVRIEGEKAFEEARYPMGKRIRAIAEAPDGSLLVLEDRSGGRLLRLSRK